MSQDIWNDTPLKPVSPDSSLHIENKDLPHSTMRDFWQWAFSDMRMNNVRGVLAEFIVARLLNLPIKKPRESWESFDLETQSGLKIEVKASAYLQGWPQKRPSKIVFSGLKTRTWTPQKGYSESFYGADVYILCVEVEKNRAKYDPLDLEQWEFYVLSKNRMEKLCKGANSLSLSVLKKYNIKHYSAKEMNAGGQQLLEQIVSQ